MQYAYVTFLMRGDGYLPGALVLAYALKTQSSYDCICLITKDVSNRARHALSLVYDKVIVIQELRIKSKINTGRSDRNILMTRFEALKLENFDKVIMLDADVLPLIGYDDLFALQTPAGIIMEYKDECYSDANPSSSKWSWHNKYNTVCPHAHVIPKKITDKVKCDLSNMGVNAGLWVLSPSKMEYNNIVKALDTPDIMALVEKFPWPEMQLATMFWSGKWTNIDIKYCSIGGYPRVDVLYGLHFAGLKPWQIKSRSAIHYAKYPDFELWYQFYIALYWSVKELREYPMLIRLYEFIISNKKSKPWGHTPRF